MFQVKEKKRKDCALVKPAALSHSFLFSKKHREKIKKLNLPKKVCAGFG